MLKTVSGSFDKYKVLMNNICLQ